MIFLRFSPEIDTVPDKSAAPAPIRAMFAIFEPKATPKERLALPEKADVIPTKSSGKEVPIAIIIAEIPIIPFLLTSFFRAITVISADLIRTTEKTIIKKTSRALITNTYVSIKKIPVYGFF